MSTKPKLFDKLNVPFLPDNLIARANTYQRLIIYTIIGGGAVVLDVGLFWVCNSLLQWDSVPSNTLSVVMAMLYSFVLNAFFNFKTRDNLLMRFAGFAVVTGIGYLLSSGMLWLLSDVWGFNALLVKTLSLPVVLVVQYLLNSKVTFRQTTETI